jgi:Malic enzyme, NAD binding domain
MVDTKGLITDTRGDVLPEHKKAVSRKDGTPNLKACVALPAPGTDARWVHAGAVSAVVCELEGKKVGILRLPAASTASCLVGMLPCQCLGLVAYRWRCRHFAPGTGCCCLCLYGAAHSASAFLSVYLPACLSVCLSGFFEVQRVPYPPVFCLQDLKEIIAYVKPHALIGLSGAGPVFNQEIVEELCKHTPQPLIFPLSNPTRSSSFP